MNIFLYKPKIVNLRKLLIKSILITSFVVSNPIWAHNYTNKLDLDDSLTDIFSNLSPYGGHFVSVLDDGTVYEYRFSPNGARLTYKMKARGDRTATVNSVVRQTKPGVYLVGWYEYDLDRTVAMVMNLRNFRTNNLYSYTLNGTHRIQYQSGIVTPIP